MSKLECYVKMLQDTAKFVEACERMEAEFDVEGVKEDFERLMEKINKELDKKLDKKVAD